MKHLWITIGIPGCGKTTWVKNKINEIGGIHISRDQIRFSLLNDNDEYFDKEILVFEQFVSTINAAIEDKCNENIFIDATHLGEGSRAKLLARINTAAADKITWVNFEVPLEIALERNDQREGRAFVPRGQIRRMFEQKDIKRIKLNNKIELITINEKGAQVL